MSRAGAATALVLAGGCTEDPQGDALHARALVGSWLHERVDLVARPESQVWIPCELRTDAVSFIEDGTFTWRRHYTPLEDPICVSFVESLVVTTEGRWLLVELDDAGSTHLILREERTLIVYDDEPGRLSEDIRDQELFVDAGRDARGRWVYLSNLGVMREAGR